MHLCPYSPFLINYKLSNVIIWLCTTSLSIYWAFGGVPLTGCDDLKLLQRLLMPSLKVTTLLLVPLCIILLYLTFFPCTYKSGLAVLASSGNAEMGCSAEVRHNDEKRVVIRQDLCAARCAEKLLIRMDAAVHIWQQQSIAYVPESSPCYAPCFGRVSVKMQRWPRKLKSWIGQRLPFGRIMQVILLFMHLIVVGASKCLTSWLIMDANIVNEFSEQSLHGFWSLKYQPAFIYVDLIYLNVTTSQTNAYLAKVWTWILAGNILSCPRHWY